MIKGKVDLEAIRDTIKHTGEVRFHIRASKSGLTATCHMWHWDGHVIGRAEGCGYDKAGAALGQAIEKLFPAELKDLPAGYVVTTNKDGQSQGRRRPDGLYGLTAHSDGTMSLDGSCGLECMLNVLEALGFKADRFETGPAYTMILGRKAK